MKKILIILIAVVLIVSFGALVYYGLRHARGVPVAIEKIERVVLEAPFIDREIDLSKGISEDIWTLVPPKEIKLMYQLMVLPWPKGLIAPISVRAFHNKNNIYFYIEWKDDTQDIFLETNRFPDACAIMFPMDEKVQPHSIMMGFLGKANIWQWKASQDREYWFKQLRKTAAYSDFYYPFEEEELFIISKDEPKYSANDLLAIRVGTITKKETHNVQARGFYSPGISTVETSDTEIKSGVNRGTWRVVFKRSLKAADTEEDAAFDSGKGLCAFGVWNGSRGDRGGRKSISDWVELVIK